MIPGDGISNSPTVAQLNESHLEFQMMSQGPRTADFHRNWTPVHQVSDSRHCKDKADCAGFSLVTYTAKLKRQATPASRSQFPVKQGGGQGLSFLVRSRQRLRRLERRTCKQEDA